MRALSVAAVALALAGCGDLFEAKAPQGYACSTSNTCPPGQQCVPSEHVCRTPCTQTTPGGMMMGSNGQCSNLNSNDNGQQQATAWSCDYDHFCRPGCGPNSGNLCSGCNADEVCDSSVNVCRPACGTGCPSTWGCVDASNGTVNTPTMCAVCRPLATSTFNAPQFAAAVTYPGIVAGQQTNAVTAGDLQGNGHASVVTADFVAQKFYVYANDGAGALLPGVAYTAGGTPYDVAVADMNRDGKGDVVVAVVSGTTGGPTLFPGNGDGTLGAKAAGPTLPSTRLAVADFDGDGKPDVAMCGMGTNMLSVVTANGSGGLKTLSSFGGGNPGSSFVRIGAADLNGDKKLDLWADDEHSTVLSYFGNGMGGFTQGQNSSFSGRSGEVTLDVDGDGKIDLVVLTSNPAASGGMGYFVTIGHNNGAGGFNTTGSSLQMPADGLLAAADFDGDGKTDVALLEIASVQKVSSHVDILSGTGSALTWTATLAVATGSPTSLTTGDVDGDGKPDLIVGLGAGGVAVLLNQTPSR